MIEFENFLICGEGQTIITKNFFSYSYLKMLKSNAELLQMI